MGDMLEGLKAAVSVDVDYDSVSTSMLRFIDRDSE